MKELHKTAELVLCPYNYIFDANIRGALEIDLSNAAVVIDEGHNVEDVCRDGASGGDPRGARSGGERTRGRRQVLPGRRTQGASRRSAPRVVVEANAGRRRRRVAGRNPSTKFHARTRRRGTGGRPVKGEECVRPVLAALGPKTTSVDEAALRAHAVRTVADGAAASAFDGTSSEASPPPDRNSASRRSRRATSVRGLLLMLENAKDYAACACADVERPGEGSGAGPGAGIDGTRSPDSRCGAFARGCVSPRRETGAVRDRHERDAQPDGLAGGRAQVPFPVKVEARTSCRDDRFSSRRRTRSAISQPRRRDDGVARNLGNLLSGTSRSSREASSCFCQNIPSSSA